MHPDRLAWRAIMIRVGRRVLGLSLLAACCGVVVFFHAHGRSLWMPLMQQLAGKRTLEQAIQIYGEAADARLRGYFENAGQGYPPRRIALLALKQEAILELWDESGETPVFIHAYPIQALSGQAGPKLREGDRQVPEGEYRVIGLNPNSAYHLSLKLNYPNPFDLRHAREERRDQPGSDIFIHGKAVSIGCLAMGDRAAEDLFVLAHRTGLSEIKVFIAPNDPRRAPLDPTGHPAWVAELYRQIEHAYSRYPMASLAPR